MNHRRPRAVPCFLASTALSGFACAQPTYDFLLVDALNPSYGLRETYLWDINDQGIACGITTADNVIGYPSILWTRAQGKVTVPMSYPKAINNTGLAVGNIYVYDLNSHVATAPPLLPGTYIGPSFGGVNDAGVAVGAIQICNCSNSAGTLQIPYVWDAQGGARTVNVPNAKGLGRINNQGVALGWTTSSSMAEAFFIDVASGAYTMMDSVFPTSIGGSPTRAYDITDAGTIVGTRQGSGTIYFYGYVYRPGQGVQILPFPGGTYQDAVKPLGINNAGTIVGEIYILGSSRGFVYSQADGIRDLNDPALVAGIPAGYTLMTAQKVNDLGWIVGYGYGGGGMYKSYVLIPRASVCPADLDDGTGGGVRDGAVDINDLLYFLVQFEAGLAPADVDNGSGTGTADGAVDINDLLFFLVRFEAGC